MLKEQQVVEIYKAKVALQAQRREDAPDTKKLHMIKGHSLRISALYGVTSRTIRDIWNRQSWAYATRHLWHLEPQSEDEFFYSVSAEQVLLIS